MAASRLVKIFPNNCVFLVCDLQARLRPAIHGFDHVVNTATKMLKVAKLMEIPVLATEQNPKGLGESVPEVTAAFSMLPPPLQLGMFSKSLFSMITPEVEEAIAKQNPIKKSIVLFGIESHVCVLQTALDLLERGYDVHVLADGVSSCNREEVPFALERMRQAGAQVTTSESISFQLMLDSALPNFKAFTRIIKEEKEQTKDSLQSLLPRNI